jgi:hypothetical protein
MVELMKVYLVGSDQNTLAEVMVADEEEGWITGTIVWQRFPAQVQKALAWYDEVLQDQMLSYLDEATADVQRFGIQAQFPDGSTHKTYALHVSQSNEISFRASPVQPPPTLPKEAIR